MCRDGNLAMAESDLGMASGGGTAHGIYGHVSEFPVCGNSAYNDALYAMVAGRRNIPDCIYPWVESCWYDPAGRRGLLGNAEIQCQTYRHFAKLWNVQFFGYGTEYYCAKYYSSDSPGLPGLLYPTVDSTKRLFGHICQNRNIHTGTYQPCGAGIGAETLQGEGTVTVSDTGVVVTFGSQHDLRTDVRRKSRLDDILPVDAVAFSNFVCRLGMPHEKASHFPMASISGNDDGRTVALWQCNICQWYVPEKRSGAKCLPVVDDQSR